MVAFTKRLALLTSGGDCAGLNAVIRAVVLCGQLRSTGRSSGSWMARTGFSLARR